jgi:prepilin signal peptidase PulO-like enzyme (type II secretory pathway)
MDALVALLGLAVGSLINLLADSLPLTRRAELPHCLACGAPRPAAAWSAVLGTISRARRCAYCGTPRSVRSLLVEAVTVAAAVWIYHRATPAIAFLPGLFIAGVFLLIIVTDVEHRLILNVVTLPSAVAFAVIGVLDPARGPVKTFLGGLFGLVLFFLLYLLGGLFGRIISRSRGRPLGEVPFGFGDVTLAALIGLAVGWPGALVALFLGILAAGAFSFGVVLVMLVRGRYTAFLPIPYGPFMILGALVVYFRLWTTVAAPLFG